jgi:hypothetical protein
MLRRFVALTSLSVCAVLAGCSSSAPVAKPSAVATTVPKPAPIVIAAQTITIQAGTGPSTTTAIQAQIPIARAGTYQYAITTPLSRPANSQQPGRCVPLGGFRLVGPQGTVRYPKASLSGVATGSIVLTAGTWTGISGVSWPAAVDTIIPPFLPGGFWAIGCPWSLTLTPVG